MNRGKGTFYVCVFLIGSILLVSGCTDTGNSGETVNNTTQAGDAVQTENTTQTEDIVQAGDTVQVNYVGMLENGTVFDTSFKEEAIEDGIYDENRTYSPLKFQVGSGQIITGFDEGVIGMKVGEEKTLTLSPEEAYGEYDEAKVQAIPLEQIGLNETLVVGQKLYTYYGTAVTVIGVNDTYAVIDFNHELAGKTLIFNVTVVSINPTVSINPN
jgi:FKBP-type peptidyl-prolyl cis-trans isomerase 2